MSENGISLEVVGEDSQYELVEHAAIVHTSIKVDFIETIDLSVILNSKIELLAPNLSTPLEYNRWYRIDLL